MKQSRSDEKFDALKYIESITAEIKAQVGNKKVICALSGGVDSSVAAVLVSRAVPGCLHCVYVDTGLMRLNETQEVREMYESLGLTATYVDAADMFLGVLAGVTDPEQKRKIVGEAFIRVFEAEAKKLDAQHGTIDFLVQGTIYPDVLETEKGQKSHHNVTLPDVMGLELCEPLRLLYKYEVREVGLALGIPENMIMRQPFPGPGLSVRCMGEVTQPKLNLLRRADAILREEIKKAGLTHKIWQCLAVLTDMRTTGIKNEKRVYGHVIAIRAVNSHDTSTAQWYHMPHEVLSVVSKRMTSELNDVVRVVYDVTDKPSATIEWE